MTHILIVEDEPRIAAFIEKGLQSNGFATSVADNSDDALAIALDGFISLIVLDLGIPGEDGLSVLANLRGQGYSAPIIILTARDDIQDKVDSFELGADDYMSKPFRFEELLARIRARLRTATASNGHAESAILQVGNLVLDLRTRCLKVDGQNVDLSAREFTLAETFFRHPNQVMSREQLLDRVWGYDYAPGSNVVDVYVGYLRKKLGDGAIETIRGMGYRLRI
ncbi:MAG: response regulator transcription factor [Cyanobacteria bacterium P01_C01_bin.70]